jgi:hypothetical protein
MKVAERRPRRYLGQVEQVTIEDLETGEESAQWGRG